MHLVYAWYSDKIKSSSFLGKNVLGRIINFKFILSLNHSEFSLGVLGWADVEKGFDRVDAGLSPHLRDPAQVP